MAELHLIGTLPQDPDGPERLTAVLAGLRPDVVAVEGSKSAYERARWAKRPGLDKALDGVTSTPGHSAATANFLNRLLSPAHTHYEVATAIRYAGKRRVALEFLGGEDEGEVGVGVDVEPVTTPELLAMLGSHDWQAALARDYARTRSELKAKACLEGMIPPSEQAGRAARDRAMAAVVERLLRDRTEGRVAVVCAATRLYVSEERLTLYSLLYKRTTARHLIDGNGALVD